MTKTTSYLAYAAILSFSASLLHIAIILGGPEWYLFFGAGEKMAEMAAQGSHTPALITLFIALIFAVWGLYALSGAQLIMRLPLLRTGLILITAIYCIRGVSGLFLPFLSDHPAIHNLGIAFWLWSSLICLALGLTHLMGIKQNWAILTAK